MLKQQLDTTASSFPSIDNRFVSKYLKSASFVGQGDLIENGNGILAVVFNKTFEGNTRGRGPIVLYPKHIVVALGVAVVLVDEVAVEILET